tara:strand:+ start:602 stop:802 length:201 start_codon:yes stop_codon:yes gene_type:complete
VHQDQMVVVLLLAQEVGLVVAVRVLLTMSMVTIVVAVAVDVFFPVLVDLAVMLVVVGVRLATLALR